MTLVKLKETTLLINISSWITLKRVIKLIFLQKIQH